MVRHTRISGIFKSHENPQKTEEHLINNEKWYVILPYKEFGFRIVDFETPMGYTSSTFSRQLKPWSYSS